jgi:hypothetical protein
MAGMSSIIAAVTLGYSKWGAPAAELLSHFRAVYVVGSSCWRLVVVVERVIEKGAADDEV